MVQRQDSIKRMLRCYVPLRTLAMEDAVFPDCFVYLNPKNFRQNIIRIENGENVSFYVDGYWFSKVLNLSFNVDTFVGECFDFSGQADELLSIFSRIPVRILFCGGSQDEIQKFERFVRNNYPDFRNVFFSHGYVENRELIRIVKENSIGLCIAGLGTHKQEEFALAAPCPTLCVGGFISQTASKAFRYYPSWVTRFNLRFVYRCATSPKHTYLSIRGYVDSVCTILELRLFGRIVFKCRDG